MSTLFVSCRSSAGSSQPFRTRMTHELSAVPACLSSCPTSPLHPSPAPAWGQSPLPPGTYRQHGPLGRWGGRGFAARPLGRGTPALGGLCSFPFGGLALRSRPVRALARSWCSGFASAGCLRIGAPARRVLVLAGHTTPQLA